MFKKNKNNNQDGVNTNKDYAFEMFNPIDTADTIKDNKLADTDSGNGDAEVVDNNIKPTIGTDGTGDGAAQTESDAQLEVGSACELRKAYSQEAIDTFLKISRKKGKLTKILPPQLAFLDRNTFSWRRDYKVIIGAFLLPMLILTLAYLCQLFYPIGDTSPLTVDLYHQYAPFISALRHKILHGESLWYSWQGGLGYNFIANLAYYTASPLNLLFALCPIENLTDFVTALTLLKVGLSGLTMALFLRIGVAQTQAEKAREALLDQDSEELAELLPAGGFLHADYEPGFDTDSWYLLTKAEREERKNRQRQKEIIDLNKENKTFDPQQFAIFIGAVLYALSGYVLSYSWNIMWLDVILVFPLVVLGINRLVNHGKFLLYTFSLAACIALNYYLAFFVCVFTIIYFIYYLITTKSGYDYSANKKVKVAILRCLQIFISSLVAGGLTAIISIPTYMALKNTSAIKDTWPTSLNFDFSFLEFLTRHLLGSGVNIRSGLPNIYCGVLVLIALPLYLACRKISLTEKVGSILVVFFLFISFNFNFLNFFWHGMHYPNQLPHRFAFVYILFMLIILFRVLQNLKDLTPRAVAIAGGLISLFLLISEVLFADKIPHTLIYLNLFFVVIYTLILLAMTKIKISLAVGARLLVIIIIGELCINTMLQVNDVAQNEFYTSRKNYVADIAPVQKIVKEISMDDQDFYRLALTKRQTSDDPALYNFNGLSIFSSMARLDMAKLMRQLGFHGNDINSYIQDEATAITDMLFNIRYLIRSEEIADSTLTKLTLNATADLTSKFTAYRRNYTLSIGYVVDSSIKNWTPHAKSALTNQNSLLKAMTKIDKPVLVEENIEISSLDNYSSSKVIREESGYELEAVDGNKAAKGKFTINASRNGQLYVFINTGKNLNINYENTKSGFGRTKTVNSPQIIDLGEVGKDDLLNLEITGDDKEAVNFTIWAAVMNEDVLRESYNKILTDSMKVDKFSDGLIEGSVINQKAGQLIFSIPYDENWQIIVDGNLQQIKKSASAFLSVDLPAGEHKIALKYQPKYMSTALMISGGALGVLLLMLIINLIYKKVRENEE